MYYLILALILPLTSFGVSRDEQQLLDACKSQKEYGCEKLGAYYMARENWANALVIGEALCKREIVLGCTYAGTSLLSQKKVKEGLQYLNRSCDQFEPFACRSLGRLFKSENGNLSHLYFRRACQYGLDDICRDLSKKKQLFTKMGESFLRLVKSDCSDTKATSCHERLKSIETCPAPLTKEDCLLMPGYLSIFFRGKVLQIQARLGLTTILAEEKKLKPYSNNLGEVLKEFKEERPRYVLGFKKACAEGKGATTLDLFPERYKAANQTFIKSARKFFSSGKRDDCYKAGLGFEAFAVGSLDAVNPSKLDVWKINHDGNLLQIDDGIP